MPTKKLFEDQNCLHPLLKDFDNLLIFNEDKKMET